MLFVYGIDIFSHDIKHNCGQKREHIDETVDMQVNLGICCFVEEIKCVYYTLIVLSSL